MEQSTLFSKNHIKAVNIFHNSPKTESKTEGSQVKLTAMQKEALKSICAERGVGMSTFISEAFETYIELYPFKEKIRRNRKVLIDLLNSFA